VGAGSYGALGPFWAIPSESLPEGAAGAAMGLVNALGNLGGWFGPLAVGFLKQRTGSFAYSFGFLGAALFLGGILAWLFLPKTRRV
jgi:MFS transporter, ACS family, tartrate transporter